MTERSKHGALCEPAAWNHGLWVGMTENNRRNCNKHGKCYSDKVRELRLEPQELQLVCESFKKWRGSDEAQDLQ